MNYTINKYGKHVALPPQSGNAGVRAIAKELSDCGIDYELEYKIDEPGARRSPFDVALMKDGKPVLFIEFDGEGHFDTDFYMSTGVRPERCPMHVVKSAVADTKKTALAAKYGIPVVRFDEKHLNSFLRDRLLALAEIFVFEADEKMGNEIIMLDFLDRNGFDFPYIPPSSMSKAETKRVSELYEKRGVEFGSVIKD